MSRNVRLSKHASPLLKTVKNQPRSEYDKNSKPVDAVPSSRQGDEEDYDRSPESSEEEPSPRSTPPTSFSSSRADFVDLSTSPKKRSAHGDKKDVKPVRRSQKASPRSNGGSGTLRSRNETSFSNSGKREFLGSQEPNDSIPMWFGQLSQKSRNKYSSQRARLSNIHTSAEAGRSERREENTKATKEFITPYNEEFPSRLSSRKEFFESHPEDISNKRRKAAFQAPKGFNDSIEEPKDRIAPPGLTNGAISIHNAFNGDNSSSASSSGLSSIHSSEFGSDEQQCMTAQAHPNEDQSCCPTCGQEVDTDLVGEFNLNGNKGWQAKLDFCEEHKKRSAKDWAQGRYPKIKWDNLDERLRQLGSEINNLLDGRRKSPFRLLLEERVGSGQNRNAFRDPNAAGQETMIPGYYGQKGAQIMQNHIVSVFSDKIRSLAATDKIILATGVAGYVQAVLVPELAVMLIGDDLGVDEDRAQEVLHESAEAGDLLNPQEEERVQNMDKEGPEMIPVLEE